MAKPKMSKKAKERQKNIEKIFGKSKIADQLGFKPKPFKKKKLTKTQKKKRSILRKLLN